MILLLVSCSSNRKFYYHDIKSGETKVYKFVNENKANDITYWEIKAAKNLDVLTTYTYNSELFLINEFQEKLGQNGSELMHYINYYEGISHPVVAEIIDNRVYSWNSKDNISYKVKFEVNGDKVTIEKIRNFIANVDQFYLNKKIKAKQYEDTYKVVVNGKELPDSYHVSYYTKGIGIIQFNLYSENKVSKMKLNEILTKKEFEEIKKAN